MNDSAIQEILPDSAAETDRSESIVAQNSRRDVIFLLLFIPLLGLFTLAI